MLRRRRSRNLTRHKSPGVPWKLEKTGSHHVKLRSTPLKPLACLVPPFGSRFYCFSVSDYPAGAVSRAGSSVFVLARDSRFGITSCPLRPPPLRTVRVECQPDPVFRGACQSKELPTYPGISPKNKEHGVCPRSMTP